MQRRRSVAVLVALSWLAFAACASGGGAASSFSEPPAGSRMAKVKPGMSDVDVRKIMGEPSRSHSYPTGKSWIPFYYGPDTTRTEWNYTGKGRVVFSRNQYSGGLKVIKVLYDPNEP